MEKPITQRHLVPRQSTSPCLCIGCNKMIPANEVYYAEEGVGVHLHSLVARRFCYRCYSMHGEKLIA